MSDEKKPIGDVYIVGESEFVGGITVRTDLTPFTVNPSHPIRFACYSYIGTEASHDPKGGPITDRASLKARDVIYARHLFGYAQWTVDEVNGDDASCTSGGITGWLRFGEDARACWIMWGSGSYMPAAIPLKLSPSIDHDLSTADDDMIDQ